MSTPFIDQHFTFTQPDGTTLEVRGTGNQHQARFETLDGFTVVQDPATGFYQYAAPDPAIEGLMPSGMTAGLGAPEALGLAKGLRASRRATREDALATSNLAPGTSRWEKRRAEWRNAMLLSQSGLELAFAPPQRHTVGSFVGLTLLIDFEDQPATIPREEVEAFCNQPGYSGFGNAGSVHDYFHDISDGRMDYVNVVAPYYRARNSRDYYTDEAIPQPKRAWELIREALEALLASGFDGSVLSSDSLDYVYALNVFYAGKRVNNWAKGLWPHAHHLAAPFALAPGKNVFDYQITDMTDALSLGTFCHENGHLICDFPDLYDYGYESNGAGIFCLMCSGGSGPAREKNPAQVGAYLKHAAGWTSAATILQPGQTVSLRAGANEFAFHRKSKTEYFVIENRASQGRDATLGADGIAVWHIDELGNNSNEIGTPTSHYECALVQADGLGQLETGVSNGDAADLFRAGHNAVLNDSTIPNCKWWDRSGSKLSIADIGPAGSVMQFKVV